MKITIVKHFITTDASLFLCDFYHFYRCSSFYNREVMYNIALEINFVKNIFPRYILNEYCNKIITYKHNKQLIKDVPFLKQINCNESN